MSGTSRIGGYGGYSGSRDTPGRSAALARFCKGRKRGDVVSGRFLRQETEELGWALLEGEELLAHLPEDGPRPSPGDRVFFVVESLHPEVVLRMVAPENPLARLSVLLPPVPLAQEAALYIAARDRVDALLLPVLKRTPDLFAAPEPNGRKAAFVECAAANTALLEAVTETLARSRMLQRAASPAGMVFFRHMPWLCGGLSQVEVSLWRSGESPVFAGARLPSGDRLSLRGEMAGGMLHYRLGVSSPEGGTAHSRAMSVRYAPARTASAAFRGVDASGGAGRAVDLVGRILALAADSGNIAVGRFSRKL